MATRIFEKKDLDELKEQLEQLFDGSEGERVLLVSDGFEGTFNSPSTRKKYFRLGNPTLAPNCFKNDSVTNIFESVLLTFIFARKENINPELISQN